MYKIVCASCMTVYDAEHPQCPNCQQPCQNHNPSGSLPEGLLLNDTYRVGAFQAIDSEGALYEALDITSQRAYQIKEYMPVTLCSGRDSDLALQVRVGSEVPYKNNAGDFTDLYAKLRHFNNDICLIGVREVFYANNTVYAVTEKAEGLSLTRYLEKRGGRLGWNEALDLLDPLWVSVERLHRSGIIHRGICCDNITVTGPGVVRLGGYAIQAMRTQGTELKAQLYTGYAAPEQYMASAFDGPFTDVYALCAVLYKVVTGVTVPAARERLNEDTLEDPSVYANDPLPDGSVQKLPLYLADAILHGLQLDGNDRFADMTAFRAALAGQRPNATAPRPHAPGGAVRTEPEKKRTGMSTDLKVGLCTGGVLLLVFLGVLLFWASGRKGPEDESSSSLVDTADTFSQSLFDSGSDSGSDSISSSSSESEENLAPRLVGMSFKDAKLEFQRYRFTVEYEYSSAYAEGQITQQDPAEGQPITDNTIAIVVSQGVQPVPMPDLEGMSRESAEALLDGLGIKYTTVTAINDGSWAEGVVIETKPGPDEQVQPGVTNVTVRVASAKPVESSSQEPPPPPSSESVDSPVESNPPPESTAPPQESSSEGGA